MEREHLVPWWGILLAGLTGTVLSLRAGGTDPGLSLDVVADQLLIEWYLEGLCGTIGMSTSVNQIAHGVNWHFFRALWNVLGLDEQSMHLLLHLSFGMAVALVAAMAWRRRGPLAGWLAATVFSTLCLTSDLVMTMVYNHRPFPLFGALATALATSAVERRSLSFLLAVASVMAIATNVHMATATWGPTMLVLGAMAQPRRPLLGALVGGFSFLLIGVAVSPGAWWKNLQALMTSSDVQNVVPVPASWGTTVPLMACRLAMGIAVARLLGRTIRDRWTADTAILLALIAPPLLAVDAGALLGKVFPSDKYLIVVHAAASLVITAAVLDLLVPSNGRFRWIDALVPRRMGRPRAIILVGFGGLALFPVNREGRFLGVDGLPMFREGDVRVIADRLSQEPEFLPSHRVFQVREPNERVLRSRLDFVENWPQRDRETPQRIWTFLKIPTWSLPEPLPEGLEVWHEDEGSRLIVVSGRPRLDWERFEFCEGGSSEGEAGARCHPNGLTVKTPGEWRGDFVRSPLATDAQELSRELRVPILPGPETALASIPLVARCTATLEVENLPEAQVDPSGRRVLLPALPEERPEARLRVRWTVGGPGCRAPESGVPPMVLEGPPEAVSFVWDLLDREGVLEKHPGVSEER